MEDWIKIRIIKCAQQFERENDVKLLEYKGDRSKQNTWLINDKWCNTQDLRHLLHQFMLENYGNHLELQDRNVAQRLLYQFTFHVRLLTYRLEQNG